MKILFLFLLVTSFSMSQGKETVQASEIQDMEFTLYKRYKREATKLDPSTDILSPDDQVQLQITVKLKDGSTLTSPLKGKKSGLQLKQFDYEAIGATPSALNTSGTAAALAKAAMLPRATWDIDEGYNTSATGQIGVTFLVWHQDDVEKKFTYFMPTQLPDENHQWIVNYQGVNTKVEVSLEPDETSAPLVIKITKLSNPDDVNLWKINPETQTITILANGKNGRKGYSYASANGGRGVDGSNGGNTQLVFVGEAKKYEDLIIIQNHGGSGGRGGSGVNGYGPDGRDGRPGKITISYQ